MCNDIFIHTIHLFPFIISERQIFLSLYASAHDAKYELYSHFIESLLLMHTNFTKCNDNTEHLSCSAVILQQNYLHYIITVFLFLLFISEHAS